ncbi:MAG: DUF2986 domain-containing protein [Pseudomonadales bacterium]|nr:DUF2986 domain-containing protein [Pseudomonadales bacterium]NRA15412.1 DUF2986 domain-containing protein [Oceanospirillaceae bacterium]
MNRKKKLNQIFNKRLKKAKSKLSPNQKGRYVSKAERASLEVADNATTCVEATVAHSGDADQ